MQVRIRVGIVASSVGYSFSAHCQNWEGRLLSNPLVTVLCLFTATYGVSQLLTYILI